MKSTNRFRPSESTALEGRVVLSAAHAAGLLGHSAGTQLVATVTEAGSAGPEVLGRSGIPRHHQFTFSSHLLGSTSPHAATPATIKVDYHNESATAITSATLADALGPRLTYVAGGEHTPPGGQLSVSTSAAGVQTVQLNLPGGVAAGAEGYATFQVQGKAS